MMSTNAHRIVIAYDIPDDRRRTKIATVLESFGERIQFSVFLLEVSPTRLLRVKARLKETMDLKKDSVLIFDLGRVGDLTDDRYTCLGRKKELPPEDAFIL